MTRSDAYPLKWPDRWERTLPQDREVSRFDTTFVRARDGVLRELRLMGVPSWSIVISSDVPLRRDGLPYATRNRYDDPGVAVYFERDGVQTCIPCDRWTRVEDNLQAIRKTIEALRGLNRWGAQHMVTAAFEGFAALPEGDGLSPKEDAWWRVLDVRRDAGVDEIRVQYRRLTRETHPDAPSGSHEAFLRVQHAYNSAMEERNT